MRSILSKKGQLGIGDAPSIIMIVGFIFLMMATLAYTSERYQDAFGAGTTGTVVNETTLTVVNETAYTFAGAGAYNFENFAVTACYNNTDFLEIDSANYTVDASAGTIVYSADADYGYNNTIWDCSYTYDHAGTSANITNALGQELDDNTSIAGIVLTISLVGIILSILIGVFAMSQRKF